MSLLKGGDIFGILLVVGVAIFLLMSRATGTLKGFEIMRNSTVVASVGLVDTVLTIGGEVSPMKLVVKGRKISVEYSGCSHQICVQQGGIGARGVIVCVPNHVTITPITASVEIDSYVR